MINYNIVTRYIRAMLLYTVRLCTVKLLYKRVLSQCIDHPVYYGHCFTTTLTKSVLVHPLSSHER
ncbi:hypothetical protein LSH36_141g07009 [Paralvinella palmiformis]|uniref:Uncharacterized protein n=1 Tax=Paralvinella palmiformis TaxID=53620 RepID=A0AAD9JV77_9ANNE|nr:hypothetical protein LSH36_141g07009 [Paralvinella palmiformis]